MYDFAVGSDIIVVRGATDILNSSYLSSISDGNLEYSSVEHFCQFHILQRGGLFGEANDLLKIPLAVHSVKYTKNLIAERFSDDAYRFYCETKDDYLRKGLILRLKQDFSFRRALMDTGTALLAHCDVNDFDYGVGMDENSFLQWVATNRLNAEILFGWFKNYESCSRKRTLGNNKLGLMLMAVRADEFRRVTGLPPAPRRPNITVPIPRIPTNFPKIMPPRRLPVSTPLVLPPNAAVRPPIPVLARPAPAVSPTPIASVIDTMTPENKKMLFQRYVIRGEADEADGEWTVSDQILALDGPYAVLSQYYPVPLVTRKRRYRSVEHYAYQKLFRHLKMPRKATEKLLTTSDPSKLSGIAKRLLLDPISVLIDDEEEKSQVERLQKLYAKKVVKKEENEEEKIKNDEEGNLDYYDDLMDYYERSTTLKFEQHPHLKQLLLATGDAMLIEICPTTDERAAREWTVAVSEDEIQRMFATESFTTGDLLRCFLKTDDKLIPANLRKLFQDSHIGCNRAGLALMRLRSAYRRDASIQPLPFPPAPPTGGELENRLVCFSRKSVFHSTYAAPFWTKEGDLYASVSHYVCSEAAKYFDFCASFRQFLAECTPDEVEDELYEYVFTRFPPPDRFLNWYWNGGRDDAFKIGSKLKFEKHPDLLRTLLETGDALLVSCDERWRSADSESSIGCAEEDLRRWTRECGYDARQLLRMTLSPPDQRPAFLGGNRMGALLMELRRDFRLRGMQPHTLPKSDLRHDALVGADVANDSGDDDDDHHATTDGTGEKHTTRWPTPYLILSKKRGLPSTDPPKRKRKLDSFPPFLPSLAVTVPGGMDFTNIDQMKNVAHLIVSRLSNLRCEIEREGETFRNLFQEIVQLRERLSSITAVDDVSEDDIQETQISFPSEEQHRPPSTSERLSANKAKWLAFQTGFVNALRTVSNIKRRKSSITDDEKPSTSSESKSIFEADSWDENVVRPLMERVWPHLTARERVTASEWLRYSVGTLKKLREKQNARHLRNDPQRSQRGGLAQPFVPSKTSSRTEWIMPQLKISMTTDTAQASCYQSTVADAVVHRVDWLGNATGTYPRLRSPKLT